MKDFHHILPSHHYLIRRTGRTRTRKQANEYFGWIKIKFRSRIWMCLNCRTTGICEQAKSPVKVELENERPTTNRRETLCVCVPFCFIFQIFAPLHSNPNGRLKLFSFFWLKLECERSAFFRSIPRGTSWGPLRRHISPPSRLVASFDPLSLPCVCVCV